jgi:hypothetical protein
MPEKVFFSLMLGKHAQGRDRKLQGRQRTHIQDYQKAYLALLKIAAPDREDWLDIAVRAHDLNREEKLTGNALIHIVDAILSHKSHNGPLNNIQAAVDRVVDMHRGRPETEDLSAFSHQGGLGPDGRRTSSTVQPEWTLRRRILYLLQEYHEDI